MATLLANTGENKKAAKYFNHALKLNPNSIPANFGMGKILHTITGVGGSSIPYFKRVLELDSNYYKAHCQLGIAYLQSKKFDKAAESIKKCLSINPKHLPGLVAMGNLLFEMQHTK